jgi:glycosyltransferase involved in cell wall biosynthesis
MDVSIVVSTRDRGAMVLPALQSMLQDQGCRSELIVVDQSATDATERALKSGGLITGRRLVYERSDSVGSARARNEGIRLARADVIAISDDDCIVPPGWAGAHLRRFHELPDVGLVYAPIVASREHVDGWIPEFHPRRLGPVTLCDDVIRDIGLDANSAWRRSAIEAIGYYDEFLGPGAPFVGADDTDVGYRALRTGIGVYLADAPVITHCALPGARTLYVRGLAAMCMKHLRCGDLSMLRPILREFAKWVGQGTGNLLRGRRPSGYRAALCVLEGVIGSFLYGVDKEHRVYRSRRDPTHLCVPVMIEALPASEVLPPIV